MHVSWIFLQRNIILFRYDFLCAIGKYRYSTDESEWKTDNFYFLYAKRNTMWSYFLCSRKGVTLWREKYIKTNRFSIPFDFWISDCYRRFQSEAFGGFPFAQALRGWHGPAPSVLALGQPVST